MTQTTTLSAARISDPRAQAIPTKPSSTVDTDLRAAFEHARRLTDLYGTSNIDVAIAWETVEELQRAVTQRQTLAKSAFARYCEAHPDAPECRIYDV